MLALSKDENYLNYIDDRLTPDNRPEEIPAKFAGSDEFQKIDRKGNSCQRWCNDTRSLFSNTSVSLLMEINGGTHLSNELELDGIDCFYRCKVVDVPSNTPRHSMGNE
jgi:hypothetical protein